jgi:hypothetical protein
VISAYRARQLRRLIEQAVTSLPDEDALECATLFEAWAPGVYVEAGARLEYGGKLYKCNQTHTTAAEWPPDSTPALWAEVAKPGEGDTPDNPIPYNNNMELVKDKYYSQSGVVYVCIRNTGVPVYNDLADLVGLYVTLWEVES